MAYIVREATSADNDALIELERNAPLELGGYRLTFDRAPNFFAHQALQPHGHVMVGEDDGRLVGVVAGARLDTLIAGKRRRIVYIHQGRTLPGYRRRHVASDLVAANMVLAYKEGARNPLWLISPDNATSLAFGAKAKLKPWPVDGRIDGFTIPDSPPSTAAEDVSAADVGELAALINRTHEGREMFMPCTPKALERRLSVSPCYSLRHWRCIRSNGEIVAAAGVWDYDCSLRIIRYDKLSGAETASIPAYVLDYGFKEGAEVAMAEVFAALMGIASDAGRSDLWMSLPIGERLHKLMEPLPHTTTLFRIIVPGVRTPLRFDRAVYLDPIYV